MGGRVDWPQVTVAEIIELSEDMFDAANVPASARREYYNTFNSKYGTNYGT